MTRKRGRSLSLGAAVSKKSAARRKSDAVERLAKHIHRASFETDCWWYDEEAITAACRACRLSEKEVAEAIGELSNSFQWECLLWPQPSLPFS
jgi:hypothetical protein